MVRAELAELLADAGFDIVGKATSADEAVAMASTLRPDAALVDLTMPVKNGLQTATEIVRRADTPVVVLTAGVIAGPELVRGAIEAGVMALVANRSRRSGWYPPSRWRWLAAPRRGRCVPDRRHHGAARFAQGHRAGQGNVDGPPADDRTGSVPPHSADSDGPPNVDANRRLRPDRAAVRRHVGRASGLNPRPIVDAIVAQATAGATRLR